MDSISLTAPADLPVTHDDAVIGGVVATHHTAHPDTQAEAPWSRPAVCTPLDLSVEYGKAGRLVPLECWSIVELLPRGYGTGGSPEILHTRSRLS